MKTSLLKQCKILAIFLIGMNLGNPVMGYLPDNVAKQEFLINVLEEISREHKVYFTYDSEMIKGISVDYERKEGESIHRLLSRVLKEVNLDFKVFEQRFVIIYKNDKEGIESLEQMIKHLEHIVLNEKSAVATQKIKKSVKVETINSPEPYKKRQLMSVSGTVTSQSGELLVGVNVSVKGSVKSTVTNSAGQFFIEGIDESAVLVFSHMGFKTIEIAVEGRANLTVVLSEDLHALDEVVVIGYGEQTRENLVGAISTIGFESIENRPVTNAATALQGLAPGLIVTRTSGQPGNENIQIQVRGATSANGNINPLLMLDGVVAPISTLQTMNPNDIDNVSILKDAAAAAIYGAQAAGGVILVTTKKGKPGKTIFQYSNIFGTNHFMGVPERVSMLEEAEFSNLSFKNAGLGAAYSASEIEFIKSGQQYYVHPGDSNIYINFNTQDNAKKTVRKRNGMQTHNFSARGGTERLNFLASMGYYNQKGVFQLGPDQFDRYNARLNLGFELTKHVSLESRIAYSRLDQETPSKSIGDLMGFAHRYRNRYPIFTPQGRLSGDGVGGSSATSYLYLAEGGYNNTERSNFDGVFTLKVKDLVKGLQVRAIYGGQYNANNNDLFSRTITTWGQFRPIASLNVPNSFEVRKTLYTNSNMQFLADYSLVIAENHHIDVLAGYQFEESRNDYTTSSASNLINNDLPVLQLGDDKTKRNSQQINAYAYQSVFGRVNYRYSDRYIFEATIRADESSRLAPGLRTKFFPSVSAAWNLHNESWMPEASFISRMKLRASWGRLGSALGNVIGNYDYLNRLDRNNLLILGTSEAQTAYYLQNVVPSSTLTWETVETINGGLDIDLFGRSLQLSADYYMKYNNNMLTPLQLPATFGVGTPRVNNGKLKSWGWEVNLNYLGKIGNEFRYNIGGNLSDNQNKLISYAGERVVEDGIVRILEGYALNSMWGFKTDGYLQTQQEVEEAPFYNIRTGVGDVKYVDMNNDKLINFGRGTPEDPGDLIYLGTDQPRYTFGITGGFDWKGFDFSFFFQGVGKRSFFTHLDFANSQQAAWVQPMKFHLDSWSEDNRNAAFPRPYLDGGHNYKYADRWIINGKYIRLKNIQVGYTFSPSLLEKAKISSLRVFFSGQDLFTKTRMGVFEGVYNPEYSYRTNWQYPMAMTTSLGLDISF